MSALTFAPAPAANAAITALVTDDGMLVRLAGHLGADRADDLRGGLLRTRPTGCNDVIVDAGSVESIDEAALAVLLAASAWTRETGGRLTFSRLSEPLADEVDALDLAESFPMLSPLGDAGAATPVMTLAP